ncbi:MAG: hypothetical protein NC432_01375 [Roseburia sp.]|nr:hypothetical protein [Roseburia sp.]MCM1098124.1 hypothetical protein [Ruminococcus flavefaciens]
MEILKAIVDTVSGWIDKANNYLQWIDREISLPDGVNIAMNTLAVICLLLAVMYLFSKKKVIEISFVDKRICVPEKSMSQQEYSMLYHNIVNAKKVQQGC